jgi:hypothetical protein
MATAGPSTRLPSHAVESQHESPAATARSRTSRLRSAPGIQASSVSASRLPIGRANCGWSKGRDDEWLGLG